MNRLWSELRRRNVIKVGVSYAVIAWLLIQVVAVVVPTFEAPQWVSQTITLLLILGFPLAVGLAWAFEVTPDGVQRTRPAGAEAGSDAGKTVSDASIDGSYGKRDVADVDVGLGARASTPPPNSLAVLPFANISPRAEDAYFATGLHEEILNHLAKISALNVVSRTSVLRFADSERPIPDIAAELNVGAVMEGSVRYSGNRIRVTAQLIDAASDRHLWSETFDREFDDVFAIESDIAVNVAGAMRAAFTPTERAAIERIPTASPEAYAVYLQAWAVLGDRSEDPRIDSLLDRAVELDPRFALAYALKAWRGAEQLTNTTSGAAIGDADREARQRQVTESASRALALDPNVPYASAALADMLLFSWRWPEAAAAYQQALKVAPHDMFAAGYFGFLQALRGEADQALALARKTSELNPGERFIHLLLGFLYGYAKQFDMAVLSFQRSIEIAPTHPLSYEWIAYMELARGDVEAARRSMRMVEDLAGQDALSPVYLPELIYVYSRLGEADRIARVRSEIDKLGTDPVAVVGLGGMAMVHLGLGERAQALETLAALAQRAQAHQIDPGFINFMNLKLNFTADPVLEEPDLRAALDRVTGDPQAV